MVYSAKSDDTNTISQFTRRKDVIITTSGTSTPSNYQQKIIITYEPEMQADFDDIRFNTKAGVYIDYWIESKTDSVTATVWIKLPDAITDPGSDTIWMYYGNTGLSDGGVGADTFIQYHDSDTADYLDSLVVTPSNIIYESKIKVTSATHNNIFGLSNTANVSDDGLYYQLYNTGNLRRGYTENENVNTIVSEAPDVTINVYVRTKMTHDGTTVHFYIDGNEIASGSSTNLPDESLGLFLWNAGGTCIQDWSFVRKYIANEPTPSYGTSQHQRRVPQFM